MHIRAAALGDTVQVCDLVRASIQQLCSLDHKDDPAILDAWLANKTPENVALWLSNPDAHLLVAEVAGVILGVGFVTTGGEVVLNYVSPRARSTGVSTALLDAMERIAWRDGNPRVSLDSTVTAHRFYERRGYRDIGASHEMFGLTAFPMNKSRPTQA